MSWGPYHWTVLHTQTLSYPSHPTQGEIDRMHNFLYNFMVLLPCKACAIDAERYMIENPPTLNSRAEFELWMWSFHNHVNTKLDKPTLTLATARANLLQRLRPPQPPPKRHTNLIVTIIIISLLFVMACLKTTRTPVRE